MWKKTVDILFTALFLVTPLLMSPQTSEIFEFNKMIFIYALSVLLLGCWLWRMISLRKIIIKKTPFDILIFAFLGIYLFSTFFSIDVHTSVWGYYGRFNGGLLSIISYLILFYSFVSLVSPEKIMRYLKISLISSFLVMLWGLPGRLGYDLSCAVFTGELSNACWTDQFRPAERMFSTLGQPNWLGAYLAIHLCLGLYFFLKESSQKMSYLYGAYTVLTFISLLFTRSRSALGAAFVGVVLIAGFYIYTIWRDKTVFIKKIPFIIVGIIFLSCVLIFKTGIAPIDDRLNFFPQSLKNEAVKIESDAATPVYTTDITESLDIRKIVWEGAWALGNKYPLFGTGPETFAYSYYFVRPQSHNLTTEWDYLYNKAHNEYLNYLATTGYTGLVLYILLIAYIIYFFLKKIFILNKKKNTTELQLLLVTLLASYITILITNFFGFSTTMVQIFFYLLPAMAYLSVYDAPTEKEAIILPFTRKQKFVAGFLSIGIILGLGGIVFYWYADTLYKKGDDLNRAGDYQSAAAYLTKALQYHNEHVYEDKLSYVVANLAYTAASQQQAETATKLISLAEYYNLRSLERSSENVLYWKTRAKNYYLFFSITPEVNSLKQAISSLEQAQKLSPTDPKIPYSLSLFNALLFDATEDTETAESYKQKSIEYAKKTVALKVDYRDGYMLLAQLYQKYGDTELARSTVEYVLKNINPKDADALKALEEL